MKRCKVWMTVLLCILGICLCACGSLRTDGGTTENPEPDPKPEYVTPVVYINVAGKQEITSKEEYLPATVTLKDDAGNIALQDIDAGVRGRGNYTWSLPKKGYRIKFNKKQSMLSDYKCKSWALLPNYTDKTLLRNYYALHTARQMNGLDWATDAKLIEVYLNDEYLGVYLLCDQTQVDANRVNVEEDGTTADTGFLIERDHYAMTDETLVKDRDYFVINDDVLITEDKAGPIPYVLKSPEYPTKSNDMSDEQYAAAVALYMDQFNYIKDYVTRAYRAAQEHDFVTFKTLCDAKSFVDYFLLDQVLSNYEIDRYSSFYLHKDKGGKLVAGPVWDYDIAAGYAIPDPTHDLRYCNTWFTMLGHYDAEFRRLYADRLQQHTNLFKSQAQKLYEVAEKNSEAIARNNEKWGFDYVYPMPDAISSLKTYKAQLDYFVDFVTRRVDYLNTRLEKWH